jgi:hypothetical protein
VGEKVNVPTQKLNSTSEKFPPIAMGNKKEKGRRQYFTL